MNTKFLLLLYFLCLFLSLVTPTQIETPAPKYLLFSKIFEEINNSEMAIYQLLKWCKQFNITIVEPFVCDSWIGGLPGWTFPPTDNFWRNIHCPLKKYSWYRDIKSGQTASLFTSMISYEEFVSRSTRCSQFSTNIEKPNLSPTVGYGRCAEICVLGVFERERNNWFESVGIVQKEDHLAVVDPFLHVDTELYFVEATFVMSSETLIHDLFKKTDKLVSEGKCLTNSVVFHGLSKMWPVVIETDTSRNRYFFWEDLSKELLDLEPSKELMRITNFMKSQVLGNRYLVLLLRVLKAVDMKDANLELWEGCYMAIISRVEKLIKQYNIKHIFLAADVLVRNTTGEIPPESEKNARNAFKILLDSGIPMVTNLETDPYWLLSGNDRGASGIIDQKIAKDADFLLSMGDGGFTRRVTQFRRERSLHTEILQCSKMEHRKPFQKSSVAPYVPGQFMSVISILTVCILVLCVGRLGRALGTLRNSVDLGH